MAAAAKSELILPATGSASRRGSSPRAAAGFAQEWAFLGSLLCRRGACTITGAAVGSDGVPARKRFRSSGSLRKDHAGNCQGTPVPCVRVSLASSAARIRSTAQGFPAKALARRHAWKEFVFAGWLQKGTISRYSLTILYAGAYTGYRTPSRSTSGEQGTSAWTPDSPSAVIPLQSSA